MSITTKTGDDGETSLADGSRLSKCECNVEAIGTVDELNSQLGVVLSDQLSSKTKSILKKIQNELFLLGADLTTPQDKEQKRISKDQIKDLEEEIKNLEDNLPKLTQFILPRGTPGSVQLHVARTICRRAERKVAAVENINKNILQYLNRLSDLLFLLSRWENKEHGIKEKYAEL